LTGKANPSKLVLVSQGPPVTGRPCPLFVSRRSRSSSDDLPATVFLSAGALEAFYEPAFAAMLSNVARLTELLTSPEYPGLKLTPHLLDGETHLSVIPATFSRGLRAVFAGV
jgi:hypothetical protein